MYPSIIIGHATVKPKTKAKNQDCIDSRFLTDEFGAVFALADGVGSSEFSEKGAEEAVKAFLDIGERQEVYGSDLYMRWSEQVEKLSLTSKIDAYRTTLLGGKSDKSRIRFYYVGNGGILHLRGNFLSVPDATAATNYANYLNSHSASNQGLEYCLSLDRKNRCKLTKIEVSLNEDWGDVFIICSDGVFSNDHNQPLLDEESGKYYIQVSPLLIEVIRTIKQVCRDNLKEGVAQEQLSKALESTLTELNHKGRINDDASLLVILTPYFQKYAAAHADTIHN